MQDMKPEEAVGDARECTLTYQDGTSRRVFVTRIETAFPIGELIVSQTDPAGIITTCNEAFVHMSGYSRENLIGQPHHILRHPDMPATAFADLWRTVREGRRWNGYVKNLRRDGGFYWVYATVIPKERNGQIVGYTSVRREPSRRRLAAAEALYRTLTSAAADQGENQ